MWNLLVSSLTRCCVTHQDCDSHVHQVSEIIFISLLTRRLLKSQVRLLETNFFRNTWAQYQEQFWKTSYIYTKLDGITLFIERCCYLKEFISKSEHWMYTSHFCHLLLLFIYSTSSAISYIMTEWQKLLFLWMTLTSRKTVFIINTFFLPTNGKVNCKHLVDLNLFLAQLEFNLNWRLTDGRIAIVRPWLKLQGTCKEK
jgi:hypothetical protein